jgi:hypothetical protein
MSPVAESGPATSNTGRSPLAGRRRRGGHKVNCRARDQKTKPPMNPESDKSPVTHRQVENSPLRPPNEIPQLDKPWDFAPTTARAQALICSPQPWGPRNELVRRTNHASPSRTPEPQSSNIRRKLPFKSLPNDAYSKIPVTVQGPRSGLPNALRTLPLVGNRIIIPNPPGPRYQFRAGKNPQDTRHSIHQTPCGQLNAHCAPNNFADRRSHRIDTDEYCYTTYAEPYATTTPSFLALSAICGSAQPGPQTGNRAASARNL